MQTTTISITTETRDRLKKLAHLGQNYNGIIAELIDLAECKNNNKSSKDKDNK